MKSPLPSELQWGGLSVLGVYVDQKAHYVLCELSKSFPEKVRQVICAGSRDMWAPQNMAKGGKDLITELYQVPEASFR